MPWFETWDFEWQLFFIGVVYNGNIVTVLIVKVGLGKVLGTWYQKANMNGLVLGWYQAKWPEVTLEAARGGMWASTVLLWHLAHVEEKSTGHQQLLLRVVYNINFHIVGP